MLDHITPVMESVAGRCAYADARHVRREAEHVLTRNGAVERIVHGQEEGVGVRVLAAGGGWAFASSAETGRAGVEGALARALELAEATGARGLRPSPLAPMPPAR